MCTFTFTRPSSPGGYYVCTIPSQPLSNISKIKLNNSFDLFHTSNSNTFQEIWEPLRIHSTQQSFLPPAAVRRYACAWYRVHLWKLLNSTEGSAFRENSTHHLIQIQATFFWWTLSQHVPPGTATSLNKGSQRRREECVKERESDRETQAVISHRSFSCYRVAVSSWQINNRDWAVQ